MFKVLLSIGMVLWFLYGALAMLTAKSAIHEILAVNAFMISAVCFVGIGIIEAIEKGTKPPKKRNAKPATKSGNFGAQAK